MSEIARESSSRIVSHSLSAFGISKRTLDTKTISVHSSPQVLASHSSRLRLNDNLVYGECRSVDRVPLNSNQLNDNCSQQRALVNGISDSLAQVWIRCIENYHSATRRHYSSNFLTMGNQYQSGNLRVSMSYVFHFFLLSTWNIFKWVTYHLSLAVTKMLILLSLKAKYMVLIDQSFFYVF